VARANVQHSRPARIGAARNGRQPVADRLAHDIADGVFQPGQWLKQVALEARYDATRIDVRRALDVLSQARMIEHIPNRGYFVHARDGQTTRDVQELRLFLELGATDGIVAHALPAGIERLRALAVRFRDTMATGSLIDLYAVNLEFHAALLDLSPNRELPAAVAALRGRISSAPATQWQDRRRIEQSCHEHFDIVEALERRDSDALRRIIRDHIALPEPG